MSIYQASTLGTTANQIAFNTTASSPYYRVTSRAPQRRDIRELDIPLPFENGISDFETLIGKTVYIIDGIMYPNGLSNYDTGLAALRKLASLEVQQDDNNSDEGYVPYVWTEFNTTKQIFVKVLYVQLPETTRKGLVQPFRLVCKVKDPTIFSTGISQASTQPADFTLASGTAVFPFSFPIIFGASTSSVTTDANNLGDIPVYPTSIQIFGPVSSPKVTNTTTGEFIEIAGVNLATDANQITITYDKDTLIVEADGNSVISSVTSASTFFKLQPGSNIISLTGSSISSDAYCLVNYRSGWPL